MVNKQVKNGIVCGLLSTVLSHMLVCDIGVGVLLVVGLINRDYKVIIYSVLTILVQDLVCPLIVRWLLMFMVSYHLTTFCLQFQKQSDTTLYGLALFYSGLMVDDPYCILSYLHSISSIELCYLIPLVGFSIGYLGSLFGDNYRQNDYIPI